MRDRSSDRRPSVDRALYFGVRDATYPRNVRIRDYLAHELGVEVAVVTASKDLSAIRNFLKNLGSLLEARGPFKIIFVAEFSTKYAFWVWLRARALGSIVVVDGFVGLFESEVEDRSVTPALSFRALKLRLIDEVAIRVADLYLIDTDVRADAIRVRHPKVKVVSLPVGAPKWAVPTTVERRRPLKVLYYGNYIPLHGVAFLVDGAIAAGLVVPLEVTLVGDSRLAPQSVLAKIKSHPEIFRLSDAVPESELPAIIQAHDIVAGIFGASPKAASVIANKVWQGLSSGRVVITRHSDALSELPLTVHSQIVPVSPASADAIADALIDLVGADSVALVSKAHQDLEEYTRSRYVDLGRLLRGL